MAFYARRTFWLYYVAKRLAHTHLRGTPHAHYARIRASALSAHAATACAHAAAARISPAHTRRVAGQTYRVKPRRLLVAVRIYLPPVAYHQTLCAKEGRRNAPLRQHGVQNMWDAATWAPHQAGDMGQWDGRGMQVP